MEVSLNQLTKRYGSKTALDQVTLKWEEGVQGLLGPNGAGKTTLMRLLATLLTPSAGSAEIGGVPLTEKGRIREMIGYLPQDFSFYPGMTVGEAMDYLALLSGVKGKAERKRRIDTLLEEVNLAAHRRTKVRALSGGMKRRLGIAQAMIHEPRLLIVDEPTAGLDPEERIRFRQLLARFAEGRVVLLSTHVVEDVESSCRQVTVLQNGRMPFTGEIPELAEQARGRVWLAEMDKGEWARANSRYPIVSAVATVSAMKVRLLADERPFSDAEPAEPTMEDGYLCLVGKGGSGR
ncbi:ABC transporter ATP-binding protein [Gorillibacterium timonense]|uniref:ABC transporter ATP-binding protein n=1 Tax=Gorillibacterium timonense TaxID=1689269 RepID=UPI00071D6054|nr:ABC transporter ATP-binding protein [Gorillibacterium timonense]